MRGTARRGKAGPKVAANGAPTTIRGYLAWLLPRMYADPTLPAWPPDAFGLCAALLDRMDGFRWVVTSWPDGNADKWVKTLDGVSAEWRECSAGDEPAPKEAQVWWNKALEYADLEVSAAARRRDLAILLLKLLVIADKASATSWMPEEIGTIPDEFEIKARLLAERPESPYGSTLGIEIDPARLLILPKIHTPQVGITLRSLSHNLAICQSGPVAPRWYILEKEFWSPDPTESLSSLNVLLLPWPEVVHPSEFRATPGPLKNTESSRFGFFTHDPTGGRQLDIQRACRTVEEAERRCGRVDLIVFPELAAQPGTCIRLAKKVGRVVIGGEGRPAVDGRPGVNEAVVAVPVVVPVGRGKRKEDKVVAVIAWNKPKFHRWKLEEGQIGCYGIGSILDPTRDWWEDISLSRRELPFWGVNSWLSFCVLICEDLARQEPIAELIRSVGPGLVIALLMDGPQLAERWPARYATVLADDPGSSVLTLTSLGMAALSRPPGTAPSRVIALWKEAGGRAREIDVPAGADGVVLCLTGRPVKEYSADGRCVDTAGQARLHGVHPVLVPAGR